MAPQQYRRTGTRVWLGACCGVMLLLALAFATDHRSGGTTKLIGTAAVVLLAVLLVRIIRAGILTSQAGVVFRNYFRTVHLEWDEIRRFERPKHYGAMRNSGLGARLTDDRLVTSSLFAAGPLNSAAFADGVVADLNAQLLAHLDLGSRGEPEV